MPSPLRVFAVLATACILSACSSVSVDKVTRLGSSAVVPQRIYVQDFYVPAKVLRVDRGGQALRDFAIKFTTGLSSAVVERVRKRIGPSSQIARGAVLPREQAWVVTGRFVTVNQGSRALRSLVGFGLGGTKVECVVTVYDLSGERPRPLLKFITTGGSNAQPGAAVGLVMPNYYLMAIDVVGKGLPGLNADVVRTSRQVVAVLSEFMAEEGLLPSNKIYRSKKLGKWP